MEVIFLIQQSASPEYSKLYSIPMVWCKVPGGDYPGILVSDRADWLKKFDSKFEIFVNKNGLNR